MPCGATAKANDKDVRKDLIVVVGVGVGVVELGLKLGPIPYHS